MTSPIPLGPGPHVFPGGLNGLVTGPLLPRSVIIYTPTCIRQALCAPLGIGCGALLSRSHSSDRGTLHGPTPVDGCKPLSSIVHFCSAVQGLRCAGLHCRRGTGCRCSHPALSRRAEGRIGLPCLVRGENQSCNLWVHHRHVEDTHCFRVQHSSQGTLIGGLSNRGQSPPPGGVQYRQVLRVRDCCLGHRGHGELVVVARVRLRPG